MAKHRIALTKIRVSCHNLAIEKEQYQKPSSLPVDQRLCSICNVIEDEVHLICACARNVPLRRYFFSIVYSYSVYLHFNSVEKLVFLM